MRNTGMDFLNVKLGIIKDYSWRKDCGAFE